MILEGSLSKIVESEELNKAETKFQKDLYGCRENSRIVGNSRIVESENDSVLEGFSGKIVESEYTVVR